ncbi:alpha/beta hydrolase family protein [Nonlabens marinus]|uniref:Tiorf87 protein n=1 Tax=Nonlabens marinus S1-08 TaxID=1454201 RepID=W8VQ77_9FLAO|nr:alpha/beta fold hydrolase [Nonlabens marinus]BAO55499.1 tiorf87 protein [Nonlabens marinus S1-08]
MNKFVLLLLLPALAFSQNAFKMNKPAAQAAGTIELNINKNINGTLLLPETDAPIPLVILFTGSGPNDRNGNSMMTRNDSHKQLAVALDSAGIATYRFDKRTFTMLKEQRMKDDVMFDDFVIDAKAIVAHFSQDRRFSSIYLAGHSQGSLVALLALDENVDGFISIAGAADEIDSIVIQQIAAQAPGLDKEATKVFKQMRAQDSLVTKVNPFLVSIVGPEIQPFMESWMVYNPKELIKDVKIPVLILNGTRDRQVGTDQAEKLHAALPTSKLVIIEGMDHLFKKVGTDDIEAAKSYTNPNFPLHPELVTSIIAFVKQ